MSADAAPGGQGALGPSSPTEPENVDGQQMTERDSPAYQASPVQQWLWGPGRAADPVPFSQLTACIDSQVDEPLLAGALAALVQEHEILRTTLRGAPGGQVAQIIQDTGQPLRTARAATGGDLDALRARERESVDPGTGPAFRALLVAHDDGPQSLILTAAAAIADLASLCLLCRELAARCGSGEVHPEPSRHLQYADFAAWHQDLLAAEAGAGDRLAWDGYLARQRECAPAMPGQTAAPGEAAAEVAMPVDGGLTQDLDAFAATHGLPVAVLLAGVFALACQRFNGGAGVVMEVAEPARHDAVRQAAGPFERSVPVLCLPGEQQPAVEFLAEFGGSVTQWADRIDYLDPVLAGQASGTARFGFRYAGPPESIPGPAGFTISAQEAGNSGPAQLHCVRHGGHIDATLRPGGTLPPQAAAALADCFDVLLREVLRRPLEAVGKLTALSERQRGQVLARACGPVGDEPLPCVHDLFAAQAARQPAALAVSMAHGSAHLSYAELDARANQLARYLAGKGVSRGDRVVISLDRSPELLVAILGVLKTGAAFVPVDPAHPAERLRYVLADAGASMLVCAAARGTGQPALVTALGEDWPQIAALPATAPRVPTGPADLAYVLYTSGTTGKPNGVQVPHRGLVNYLSWCADAYDMAAGTGALTHSSISFDFTLTTLLGPLLAGQQVIMVPEDGAGALAAVLRSRRGQGLSVVKLTPTHLNVLGQLLTRQDIDGAVRTLVVGGEALDAQAIALFRAAGARIVNEYGPTETVVGSTAYAIGGGDAGSGPVPIGRPIANTAVYLLDSQGRLVPDGAPGEICIAGTGVSSGYLGRPGLTEARFVPEFGAGPRVGARMYRTGDLARWRADGELEYLGRIDGQIKVNGIRIEPAEIEAVLLECDGVGQAVVTAWPQGTPGAAAWPAGAPSLAAYVVPARGHGMVSAGALAIGALAIGALAMQCRARLPEQLVPRAFVILEALPMTVNGKLDRAALPKPDAAQSGAAYVAPRTDTEEVLAGAVASVLGRDGVGIDDNYFVLGGDSIRSVMIASRAQARGIEVTVADLHAEPTVRRLSERLARRERPAQDAATEPFSLITADDRALVPDGVDDAFPLNLLQEGMIFHRDFAAKSAVYHAIASIRLKAPYEHEVMRVVIDQLVQRHPMLRTSFDMTTFSHPMQLVHASFESPLFLEDLRDLSPDQRERRVSGWISEEKARGFELHEFPLIRFMVQRLTGDAWQFTYGFHHEIVDGWSEALMITELFSHYFSVIYDEPISIRPPTSTMRDAVALELAALSDKQNFAFWDAYLAGATVMRLPRFGAGLKADKGARDIARIAVPVSAELSDQVKRLAVGNAVPLKNILMAAHMVVMSTYGGHADTLTYTVGNGRPESADGSTAIGLFVNSLALRVRTGGGTWRDLIEACLESERASMPYRRLPMAELKRHQGSEPLAETLFFFTNYHVFAALDRWTNRGVSHVATDLYGESTFPFCAINRLNRETGHLEIRLEYDALQFSAELMSGIRDCYAQVLEAMTADPGGRYDAQSFAPAADQAKLAQACWGPAAGPPDRCLHQIVEEQARARPDAVALDGQGAAVSYRELNRRAGQLAALLRARGAGPGQVIGVLAERSVEQIVAILAVLKTGCAYLPLDPVLPAARIAAILADATCHLVITQPRLARSVPGELATVSLDPAMSVLDGLVHRGQAIAGGPASAAYVIYTSGSTGEPKGVIVEHRNVVATTLARQSGYGQPPGRFLLLSSAAFDSSVAGLFWTLTQGGTLVLPDEGLQREPAGLVRLIRSARPTHTLGIPSLLKLLLGQAGAGDLDSLQVVVSAGEPCPAELAASFARRLPGCSFHNEYGPTEGTVWATKWSWQPGSALGLDELLQVPIGRPAAGGHVLPLNHRGKLVPAGVTGELHIGGTGVARGYLGRPAETAASFRPDAFATRPGSRCYATGDLGRVLPDGVLEFQGRADHQVKIQGFRVELGAVESLLDTHDEIQRSIVVTRGTDPPGRALIAYVVPVPGATVEPEQVRQYVRDRLPRYMVPAAVVIIAAVPLTATGKVDRAALPPVSYATLAGAEYVAPRNDIEAALAAIWCKVLQLDRVGVRERFFDLGGESLLAMQAISVTNETFNTSLSVRQLFGANTIGELAAEVSRALSDRAAQPADAVP
jgi:nonribosomal peptide synthetase protein BlmX